MTNLATDLILGNILLFQNNMEICYKPKKITILKDGFTQIIPMNKPQPWYLRLLTVESISTLTEKPIDFLEIRTTQVHNIKLLLIMDLNNKYDEIERNYLSEIDNNFMLTKVRKEVRADNSEKSIRLNNASTNPKTMKLKTLVGYLKPETLRTHNLKGL